MSTSQVRFQIEPPVNSFRFGGRNAEGKNRNNCVRDPIEIESVQQSIVQRRQNCDVSELRKNYHRLDDHITRYYVDRPAEQLIDLTETSDEEEFAATPVKKQCLTDVSANALEPPTQELPPASSGKVKLSPSFKKIISTSPIVKLKRITSSDAQPARRYPCRVRRPPVNMLAPHDASSSRATTSKDRHEKKDKKKVLSLEDLYDWSDCKVALEHDQKYNFFPKDGPSHINYYENVPLPGYYGTRTVDGDDMDDGRNQSEYDIHFESMYEASMQCQSPTNSPDPLFNTSDPDDDAASASFQISTPLLQSIKANFMSPRNKETYIATPITITPTAATLLLDLINYDIPQVVSKTPFYGNGDDVTNGREVGNHMLRIPNLNECDTFDSSLVATGLNAWRQNMYKSIMSLDDKEKLQEKSLDEIREFFAVQKRIVIQPSRLPPTVRETESWLRNSKKSLKDNGAGEVERMDVDSPIQIRREKAKIILENGGGDGDEDDDDDNECDVSLNCSPLAALASSQDAKLVNKHLTKVSNRSIKAKKSLNSTFDELKRSSSVVRESPSMFSGDSESPTVDVPDSDEEVIPSSQVISIKQHLRPQNNNKHVNGHTDNTSNCRSDASPLVNSVS